VDPQRFPHAMKYALIAGLVVIAAVILVLVMVAAFGGGAAPTLPCG